MKKMLTDFSGQTWYVESDKEIAIKPCPACGKPLEVSFLSMEPPVSIIAFRNSEGKILGMFDTEAFISPFPTRCHFCGYEDRHSSQNGQDT